MLRYLWNVILDTIAPRRCPRVHGWYRCNGRLRFRRDCDGYVMYRCTRCGEPSIFRNTQ